MWKNHENRRDYAGQLLNFHWKRFSSSKYAIHCFLVRFVPLNVGMNLGWKATHHQTFMDALKELNRTISHTFWVAFDVEQLILFHVGDCISFTER